MASAARPGATRPRAAGRDCGATARCTNAGSRRAIAASSFGAWAADVVTACVKIFVTVTGSPVPDGIQLTPGPLVSELRRVQSRAVIEPVNRSILRHDEAKNLMPTRVRAKVEGTHGRRLAYFARRRRHFYAAKVGLQYCVAPGTSGSLVSY